MDIIINYNIYQKYWTIYEQETGDYLPEKPPHPPPSWWILFNMWHERYQKWLSDEGIEWKVQEDVLCGDKS
jgi:hypothetical protein